MKILFTTYLYFLVKKFTTLYKEWAEEYHFNTPSYCVFFSSENKNLFKNLNNLNLC